MLEDMFEKYRIVNSVGEEVGKIKEVYIDLNTWEIRKIKVSPGIVKSSFMLDLNQIKNVDLENNRMVVDDDFEKEDIPESPRKELYPYDELCKQQVVDSEGEKIGKIYSVEIPYEKLKKFKIWKLLIKTGLKDRRLRVSPTEVGEIMENINLIKGIDFYQGTDEEEK